MGSKCVLDLNKSLIVSEAVEGDRTLLDRFAGDFMTILTQQLSLFRELIYTFK